MKACARSFGFALWVACSVACSAADAASIRVEAGCSLTPYPCGPLVALERNGPAAGYFPITGGEADHVFSLGYVDDSFVITALVDNDLGMGVTFFVVYPGTGPAQFPCSGCATNAIAYVPGYDWPDQKGEQYAIGLPPAVPEPASGALAAAGLALLARRHRRRGDSSKSAD